MDEILTLKNITKKYPIKKGENVLALSDFSFDFNENRLYFILGKSGSGKSTLINIIAGLDKPTSGEIFLDDKNITDFKDFNIDNYRNTFIGFIFQEYNLLSDLSVKENIALALQLQGKKILESEILEVLDKVNIKDLINRKINELSGGQKQRVAIARALIKKPRIIIADEPTGSLDKETSIQIFDILKELSKDHLVIAVSHNEDLAVRYAGEIIKLENGKISSIDIHSKTLYIDKENDRSIINSQMPFLTSFKIGFSYLKIKFSKLIITILLSVMAFTCLGIAITANDYDITQIIINSYVANGYKENLTIYELEETSDNYWNSKCFSLNDINKINEDLNANFKGVYKQINLNSQNFLNIPTLDYKGTYDTTLLLNLSGLISLNKAEFEELGYSIYGNYPTSNNEIAIPYLYYETYKKYGYIDSEISLTPNEITIESLIGKTIKIGFNDLTISGIIDTKLNMEEFSTLKYYNNNDTELNRLYYLYNSIVSYNYHSVGFMLDCASTFTGSANSDNAIYQFIFDDLPNNKNSVSMIVKYFNQKNTVNNKYYFNNSLNTKIDGLDSNLNFYKNIAFYSGLILLLFSTLLLFSFINNSISNKEKEMGIFKALGARSKDVFMIFSCEGIYISIINFILSSVICSILINYFNNSFNYSYLINFDIYNFNFWKIIILFLIIILSTFIAILIPIIKISRKSPIQTINNK